MTDADLDELVARVTEATSALIGGHIRRYFDLVDHADDFTPHARGRRDLRIRGPRCPRRGRAPARRDRRPPGPGLVATGDPVFRHEGSRWRLGHRHADALVHPINFDQLAALARGAPG
jgi:hypothetical protein